MATHAVMAKPPDGAPDHAGSRAAPLTLDALSSQPAGDNRLFLEYNAAGKARWNPAWPGQMDMTGVAWDSPRSATAITRRHIVMAGHYPRSTGDTIVFHDRNGDRHARQLEKVVSFRKLPVGSDIAVGLLDRPLPDGIKTYPLLEPRADYANRLSGGLVLITEQKRRLFIHEILFVNERSMKFTHGAKANPSVQTMLTVGDSGNPAFVLVEGEPVLVETHTIGGAGAGPFYSTPPNFETLQRVVRELNPNYQLKTRTLEKRYTEAAEARRGLGKDYAHWSTNGIFKPRPVTNPRRPAATPGGAAANPRGPAANPPARKPVDPRVPRVRRLPDKKSPEQGAPAPK